MRKIILLSMIGLSLSLIAMEDSEQVMREHKFNRTTLARIQKIIDKEHVSDERVLEFIKVAYYAKNYPAFRRILKLIPDAGLSLVWLMIDRCRHTDLNYNGFKTEHESFKIIPASLRNI